MSDGMRRGRRWIAQHSGGRTKYRSSYRTPTTEDRADWAVDNQQLGGMIMIGAGIAGGLLLAALATSLVWGAGLVAACAGVVAGGVYKFRHADEAYDKYIRRCRDLAREEHDDDAGSKLNRTISPVFKATSEPAAAAPGEPGLPASQTMKPIQFKKVPAGQQPVVFDQ